MDIPERGECGLSFVSQSVCSLIGGIVIENFRFKSVSGRLIMEIFPRQSKHLVLREGYITSTVLPKKVWRVQFESTEWFARNIDSGDFQTGDCVQIVGKFDATTLLIEAV